MSEQDRTSQELEALDRLLASLPAPAPASAALKDRLEAVSQLPQEGRDASAVRKGQLGPAIFRALFGDIAPRSLIPQAAGLTMICLVGGVVLGLSSGMSGYADPAGTILQLDPTAYVFGDPGLERDLEELD